MLVLKRSSSPCADEESGEAAERKDDGGSVLLADGARLGALLLREESGVTSRRRDKVEVRSRQELRLGKEFGHEARQRLAAGEEHGAGA